MHYSRGTIAEESPFFAKYLVNERDSELHVGSAKKVDWICPSCGMIVRSKSIDKVIGRNRIPCDICRDGVSMPEKIVAASLSYAYIDFISQATFPWSCKKRYDFYIPDFDSIIEVHGSQHYGFGFAKLSGISYEQQKEIDALKEKLAIENGIKHYYVINASVVDTTSIICQLSSTLSDMGVIAPLNPKKCEEAILTSKVVLAADLWNRHITLNEMSEVIGVSRKTVINYLKRAATAGLCDYDTYQSHLRSQQMSIEKIKRKVRCITTGEVFDSIRDASKRYGIKSPINIIDACKGRCLHAGRIGSERLTWEYCDQ